MQQRDIFRFAFSKPDGLFLQPVKIFAFIMAFLVLALSIMPCADKGVSASDGKAKTEITKSTQHSENPQQDECTPFCHCTCCACFSINHFIASITHITPYLDKTKAAYLPADVIEIALPIWQPPKLS